MGHREMVQPLSRENFSREKERSDE